MEKKSAAGKFLVVIGAGESGTGTAVLAQKQGYEVFVSDLSTIKPEYRAVLEQNNIPFEENIHSLSKILTATEAVKSPGIPDNVPIIRELRKHNIPVVSEIEFAGRFTDAKMICITGSNGKTTTTTLIYHILKNSGYNVGLAGNVGRSFAMQVATENFDYYVLELSSFQLDGMTDFKANIAILLNITPDHLERYDHKFENYVRSKLRITQNQTDKDALIFWEDDPVIHNVLKNEHLNSMLCPFAIEKHIDTEAFVENGDLVIQTAQRRFKMRTEELSLKGQHNLYNSMAAGLAALIMDVKKEDIRKSLADFQGIEHRLEYVATVRNVRFINDSKATNVNSCWYALQSMQTPVVLILGGTDKGNDYREIEQLVAQKVRALVFLGVDNSKLHSFFDGKVEKIADAITMKDAVNEAYKFASDGDTVLLSPCCASFDLFKNYEDRGRQFKTCVRNL
ncbi:MAG: UDP-N-acetylmuramoyl-L-alanine--D-glutamate ligase [Prevotellaceae bacterium]|jgi:UDP-N-acetylmuramoylalanine--D-glutamate ligase|nr:UDP-N-acetylmuramoyl-L-alanine--D-glutamate ligase [Prevotellaceae bacterium]